MVKKILVIDFSYIMYNVIKVYKDRVNLNENPTLIWKMLEEDFGLNTNIVRYDARSYKEIVDLVCDLAKFNNITDYKVAMNMNEITKEMLASKDTYEIINIDYFDDLYKIFRRSNNIDNLNWVNHLYHNDKIESYRWIKTITSFVKDNYPENTAVENKIKFARDIIPQGTDISIIITFSPQFVPYEYKTLFDTLDIILRYATLRSNNEEG